MSSTLIAFSSGQKAAEGDANAGPELKAISVEDTPESGGDDDAAETEAAEEAAADDAEPEDEPTAQQEHG